MQYSYITCGLTRECGPNRPTDEKGGCLVRIGDSMNPNSAVPPTGKSGRFGRHATRLKSLAMVGALTLGAAGAAFAAAAPATADPAVSYVAVGSDVTQDVINGWAAVVSNGTIGSYNAVNQSPASLTRSSRRPR
jgi:hypothetical protein